VASSIRSGDPIVPSGVARTPFAATDRASMRTRPAAGERARSPFVAAISFITSIARSRSATIFFNRLFSCSSARRRLVSSAVITPKRLRQT